MAQLWPLLPVRPHGHLLGCLLVTSVREGIRAGRDEDESLVCSTASVGPIPSVYSFLTHSHMCHACPSGSSQDTVERAL